MWATELSRSSEPRSAAHRLIKAGFGCCLIGALLPALAACTWQDLDYHRRLSEQYRIKAERELRRGKNRDAELSLKVALEHSRALGGWNFMLAAALDDMGQVKIGEGRYAEAKNPLLESLAAYGKIADSREAPAAVRQLAIEETAHVHSELGGLSSKEHDLPAARSSFLAAIETFRDQRLQELDAFVRPELAHSLAALACVVRRQGQSGEADRLARLALRLKAYGSPDWLATRQSALENLQLGRTKEAEKQLLQAFDMVKVSRIKDVRYFQTVDDLATFYEKQGDSREAARWSEERLNLWRPLFRPGEEELNQMIERTAVLYARAGNPERAGQFVDELVAANDRGSSVSGWLKVVATVARIGFDFAGQGLGQEARRYRRLAEELTSKHIPRNSQEYLLCCQQLFELNFRDGDLARAAAVLEEAFSKCSRANLYDTAYLNEDAIRLQLAFTRAGALDRAERICRLAVSRGNPLSRNYPTVLRVLGRTLVAQGKFREAERCLKESLKLAMAAPQGLGEEIGCCYGDLAALYESEQDLDTSVIYWSKATEALAACHSGWLAGTRARLANARRRLAGEDGQAGKGKGKKSHAD